MSAAAVAPPSSDGAGAVRLRELDAMRAIAVLMVMGYHYVTRYAEIADGVPAEGSPMRWGVYGVHVFFMISGFVILMTAERASSGWGVWGFLRNRAARLYPAFWVGCALTYCVVRAFGLEGREVSFRDALLNLTMFPARMIDGVYWSLKVEWVFYGIIAVLIATKRLAAAAWVLAAVVGVDALGLDFLGKFGVKVSETITKYFAFFLIGMIAYQTRGSWRMSRGQWVCLAVALLGLCKRYDPWMAAMLCGFAAMLFMCTRRRVAWLANPVLVFVGTISYGLYLVHQNIGYIVIREVEERGAGRGVAIGCAVVVAMVLATGLTFLVERPVSRVLRGWTGGGGGGAGVAKREAATVSS